MAALIITTDIGAPAIGTDKPAYLLFHQLRLQLQRDLGDDIAAYLAEPVFDGNQDEIDWYATIEGKITAFKELSESEKINYIGQIEGIRKQLNAAGERYIRVDADPAKLTIGKALIAAAAEPELQYRYLVGKQPVVVFWGFIQQAPDYPELLKKYIEIHHKPETPPVSVEKKDPVEKPKPVEKIYPKLTAASPQPTTAATVTPFSLPPEEFNLLKYAGKILWGSAFLALFILATLLLLNAVGLLHSSTASSFPSSSSDTSASLIDQIRQATTSGDALQKQLAGLQSTLAKKLCDCEPGPTPKTESSQIRPVDPAQEAEIEEVVESCDIAKLAGRWQSHSNDLHNAQSGKPIIVNYDFDVQGQGSIGITEIDNSQCQGKATAQFEKTNDVCVLTVRATKASCPSTGAGYNSHEVSCQLGENGKAKCTLLQKETDPIYAEFERRSSQG